MKATSFNACTAWARCSTRNCSPRRRRRLSRLCPGRQPSRSARISGAAAAGERRQFVVCRRGSRCFGAGRGDPQAPAGLDRRCAARRYPQIPLPRDLYRPARVNSPVSSSVIVGLEVLLDDVRRDTPAGAQATPLIDGAVRTGAVRPVVSPIDRKTIVGHVTEADTVTTAAAMARPRQASPY